MQKYKCSKPPTSKHIFRELRVPQEFHGIETYRDLINGTIGHRQKTLMCYSLQKDPSHYETWQRTMSGSFSFINQYPFQWLKSCSWNVHLSLSSPVVHAVIYISKFPKSPLLCFVQLLSVINLWFIWKYGTNSAFSCYPPFSKTHNYQIKLVSHEICNKSP